MTDQPLVPVAPGGVEAPVSTPATPAVAPVEAVVEPVIEQAIEPVTESVTEPELPQPVEPSAVVEAEPLPAQVDNAEDEDPVAVARAAQARETLAEDAAQAAREQLQGLPGAEDRNTQTGAQAPVPIESSPATAAVATQHEPVELIISQAEPGKTSNPSQVIETP